MATQQQQMQRQQQSSEERPAELDELQFDDDQSSEAPEGRAGDQRSAADVALHQSPARVREAGLTAAAMPEEAATDDDLSPETLIPEDGARSPDERGGDSPNDKTLRRVAPSEIGAGSGLDEAELAEVDPYDGKRE